MSDLLEEAVQVSISATSATPSLPGFDKPVIIGYHTKNTDLLRVYTDLDGMAADGFETSDPLYRMAESICKQNPRPAKFVVIRGTTAIAQGFTLKVTDANEGDSVGCVVTSPDGTETSCYHTVTTGQDADAVATALATLIDAIDDLTASATTDTVTGVGANAGEIFYVSAVKGCQFTDTTADASADDDLNAAILVNNSWYGISGAWLSSANIDTIAGWADTNKKLHGYTTADEANEEADSGIFNTLKGEDTDRSIGLFSGSPQTYGGTGWLARQIVQTPGASNWAFKSIKGTAVDSSLTPTQRENITGNNGNYYYTLGGEPSTFDGRTASGQFADITLGVDALTRYIQLRIATILLTSERLEYDRAGLAIVAGAVRAGIGDSIRDGFVSNESGNEPQVSVPDLDDVPPEDKGERILKNVKFTCVGRGAINSVRISGTVNL